MVTRVVERGPAPINVGEPRRGQLPITRSLTFVYALSSLLAILLVVTSVAGLMFGQRGLYTPDPPLCRRSSARALTLLLGLPLLIGSMMLARRGSLGGLVLWTGALFYFAYSVRLGALTTRRALRAWVTGGLHAPLDDDHS